MLVLMLMSMLMSHASVDFFVLSFVLPCAYAYVASENQALEHPYDQYDNAIICHKLFKSFQLNPVNCSVTQFYCCC